MAEIEVIEVEVAGAPDVIELYVPGLQGPAAGVASEVSFDPAGNIAVTNVQDAI